MLIEFRKMYTSGGKSIALEREDHKNFPGK